MDLSYKDNIHDVVGAIITAGDNEVEKALLFQRMGQEHGEKYWPNHWCYLTEHIKADEVLCETLARGIEEETGLISFELLKGPIITKKVEPLYRKEFIVNLVHVRSTSLDIVLNEENQDYTWHPLRMPLRENNKVANKGVVIFGLYEDFERVGLDLI